MKIPSPQDTLYQSALHLEQMILVTLIGLIATGYVESSCGWNVTPIPCWVDQTTSALPFKTVPLSGRVIIISNISLGANGFSQRMKAPPGLIFSVSPEKHSSGVSIVMNQVSLLRVCLRRSSMDTPRMRMAIFQSTFPLSSLCCGL